MLLCLVSIAWLAVLAGAAAMRRVQLPVTLWLSGSTTALAFAALWLTPSKWTHHFGALAGVGSAFLALFLVLAVPTTRSVLGMWRLPFGLVAAVVGSYVLAIALSWHGPNQWPYAWLDGVRRPTFTPAIKHVLLDSPLLWLLVLVVVVGVLVVSSRLVGSRDPRLNVLRAVPILVAISLVGTTVYTLYTFGLAARRRAALLAVPRAWRTHREPVRGGGTEVLDPFTAVPLEEAPGRPPRRRRPASWRAAGTTPETGRRASPQAGCGAASWPGTGVGRAHGGAGHHLLVHAPGPDAGRHRDRRRQPADGITLTAEHGARGTRSRQPAPRCSPTPRTTRRGGRARSPVVGRGRVRLVVDASARSTAGWRSPRRSSPGR